MLKCLVCVQSLLNVLRESHRTRTVFRKVGGFVYVMSVLVSMEGSLEDPPKSPWHAGEKMCWRWSNRSHSSHLLLEGIRWVCLQKKKKKIKKKIMFYVYMDIINLNSNKTLLHTSLFIDVLTYTGEKHADVGSNHSRHSSNFLLKGSTKSVYRCAYLHRWEMSWCWIKS